MMFNFDIRVYYEDTDSGGIVYYANYLKFIERARTEYLRSLNLEQDVILNKDDTIFVVKKIEADYKSPALFNDLLEVQTRVQSIGVSSIVFSQDIFNKKDNKVLFKSFVTVVCLNYKTFKPKKIPDYILERINE